MDKGKFDLIKKTLEQRVKNCQDMFDSITAEHNLIKITVEELIQLKTFSDKEINIQTRILQSDLYHIIGMGNLSASQTSILMKLIQSYSSYRPDLHALNSWNGSILELPKIPRRVKHKLKEFSIELINGRSGDIEDEDDSDQDIVLEKFDKNDIGTFDGTNIKLVGPQVMTFAERISKLSCYNLKSAKVVYDAILAGKLFGGIQWMKKDSYYLGCPANDESRNNIKKLYSNLI